MKDKNNYYITTAIAYTSAKPHIGNVYEIVLADAIARFKKAQGSNVFFQTGTDEHGQKIEEYALKAGVTPQQHVDSVSTIIRGLFDLMNVDYDNFVRTTDIYHKEQVAKIFKRLYDQDDLYKGEYEGWYCKADEAFYTDSQIENETCPDCGAKVERQKEETYFLRMSKYQDRLVQHIHDHPNFIQPESRKNEMLKNFLQEPLLDLAVSRTSFKWGIPVDFDPKHVVYVWIDALVNYITGIGYDADGNHSDMFKEWWPADVHLIGKDILRFHTIYWPIILMALDLELPHQIFGHPWLLSGEAKMSKSKGNAVYVDDVASVLGVDPVRYIMLHEMPFERDGFITNELMIERINTNLANIIGNLVNRTVSMVNKYHGGVLLDNTTHEPVDDALIAAIQDLIPTVEEKMETLHVSDSMTEIINLFRLGNKYIDDTQPWVLAKEEASAKRLQTVLYNLVELIRVGGIALASFIPETSAKILKQIGVENANFNDAKVFGILPLGHQVTSTPEVIFNRLDKAQTLEALDKAINKPVVALAEAQETITIDDFKKVVMVSGTIEAIAKHPKADKLYVCSVNIGTKVVQIVSGLVDYFTTEELLGKRVVVVENLKPVSLRGVDSYGMILAAKDGKTMHLVSSGDAPNGTRLS